MADPKVGTGKKPKGSGSRLYTDENPRDTVRIKFATPADARATVAKVKRVNKPFARKIQILTVGEQKQKLWVSRKWLIFLRKGKMPSEKRKKFDGKMHRVSNLKAIKKSLVKNLMQLEDVGTALKKKDKTLERKATFECIIKNN